MKVKVCFLCKQYVPIHLNNPVSESFVRDFGVWHHKHPIGVVEKDELTEEYQSITPESRKKALEELAQKRLSFI